jgi:hypothetical protein
LLETPSPSGRLGIVPDKVSAGQAAQEIPLLRQLFWDTLDPSVGSALGWSLWHRSIAHPGKADETSFD